MENCRQHRSRTKTHAEELVERLDAELNTAGLGVTEGAEGDLKAERELARWRSASTPRTVGRSGLDEGNVRRGGGLAALLLERCEGGEELREVVDRYSGAACVLALEKKRSPVKARRDSCRLGEPWLRWTLEA